MHKIGAEDRPTCRECYAPVDNAQHALESCPRFAPQRKEFRNVTGFEATLDGIIKALIGSKKQRETAAILCKVIMRAKEDSERERERSDPHRRARRQNRTRRIRRMRDA